MTVQPLPIHWRPERILVWLHGALGDTLLGFPALGALRNWATDAQITVVGRPSYLEFARDLHLLDAVDDSDGPRARSVFQDGPIRFAGYDLAVIWSGEHGLIARRLRDAGTRVTVGAWPRGGGRRHQSCYLLDTLAPLGIDSSVSEGAWHATGHVAAKRTTAATNQAPTVILHPGAGSRWKRWPLQSYVTLAEVLIRAGSSVRWTFGPADRDVREMLRPIAHLHFDVCADLAPAKFAAIVEGADLLVSSDTGPAHLAALLGVPTITLFGPTDAERWRPWGHNATVIEANVKCGGTWKSARANNGPEDALELRCCNPLSQPECACLAAVRPQTVFDACIMVMRHAHNGRLAPHHC